MIKNNLNILITGGAGFIGSALVRKIVKKKNFNIINIDKLSYASDINNLKEIKNFNNYKFIKLDISNLSKLKKIFKIYDPSYVINCAAESHVDNSIKKSDVFIQSNIIGTYNLLECIRLNQHITKNKKKFVLFHQVSTDEVFGDSDKIRNSPNENSTYKPSSPYSASKASADHLVTAWGRTFKIPYTISICTNNYGPFQFPEKFLPKIIMSCLNGKKIPVYGDGKQIRDWLYVEDHVEGIIKILFNKKYINQSFNISGNNQIKNIDLVNWVCKALNEMVPIKPKNINDFRKLINFVKDRPGHDRKYFLNSKKINKTLKWKSKVSIHKGIDLTLRWYLNNLKWTKNKL